MHAGVLAAYERSLLSAEPLHLVTDDGREIRMDTSRWLAPIDDADRTVIERCRPPVLDVGCGPGRFVLALAERGMAALGVDIAMAAVSLTRRRGGPALQRSVFDRTPGEGRWPTVLLMDDNLGIGGDPAALLARIRTLLTGAGRVLVETHASADVDARPTVRLRRGGELVEPAFPWAEVGVDALHRYAKDTGYVVGEVWSVGGRSFALLTR